MVAAVFAVAIELPESAVTAIALGALVMLLDVRLRVGRIEAVLKIKNGGPLSQDGVTDLTTRVANAIAPIIVAGIKEIAPKEHHAGEENPKK
jgi:hypothetical protein